MLSKEELHNAICANYKYGIQVWTRFGSSSNRIEKVVSRQYASFAEQAYRTNRWQVDHDDIFYENEELLNEAQVIAAKWWEIYGHHVYEAIVFDGPTIDWTLSKYALIIIWYKICCFAKFYDCPAL